MDSGNAIDADGRALDRPGIDPPDVGGRDRMRGSRECRDPMDACIRSFSPSRSAP